MKNSILWVKRFFIGCFIFLFLIILFNIIVDPIGIFKHKFSFNSMQDGFD